MLWRIVGKLLFKATLSVVLVLGVLSYGHYLRGGDPGALWKNLASNGASRSASRFVDVLDGFSTRIVGVLNGSLDGVKREAGDAMASMPAGSEASGSAAKTTVHTWQDAEGVTHFSQSAPAGIETRTMTIDPNVNVLAPVRRPERAGEATQHASAGTSSLRAVGSAAAVSDLASDSMSGTASNTASDDLQAIGGMPGIAGQLPSLGSTSPETDSVARQQLIKMLQPSH